MHDNQLYRDRLESNDEKLVGIEARERWYASHDATITEIESVVTAKFHEEIRNRVAMAVNGCGLMRWDERACMVNVLDTIREDFKAIKNPSWPDFRETCGRIESFI